MTDNEKLISKMLKLISKMSKLISKMPKLISKMPKLISTEFYSSGLEWIWGKKKPAEMLPFPKFNALLKKSSKTKHKQFFNAV